MHLLSRIFCLLGLLILSGKMQAQCFTIESILADACVPGNNEGQNEMVLFTVGSSDLNTSNLTVNFPSGTWSGVCQNGSTALIVSQLNSSIINSYGQLLEPTGGVLPANAKVILVTGYTGFIVSSNSFAALSEIVYIIFHCSTSTQGYFANSGSGTRILSMSFGSGVSCSESVEYTISDLIGGNGASVNFTPSGADCYVNSGGFSPFPFYDPSWTAPSPICSNAASINLNTLITGTTGGTWSSAPGVTGNTFSPAGLSGNQNITYTYTPACGSAVSQTHAISVNPIPAAPTLPALVEWCSGSSLPIISAISSTTSLNWFSDAALTTSAGVIGNSLQITDSSIPAYYVYDEISNCQSNTVTININVKPTPSPPSVPSLVQWCSGTILPSISATSTATSINWYSDMALANLVGTGNSFQISSSSIPRYYVTGESNGCTSSTSIVDFNIELPVTADIIGNAVIDACLPDVVTLQSASLSNNQWSTGATTQSIQVIQPGTYTLTVVGFCNSATDVVTINDVSVDASFQIDLENSDMLPLSATLITENNLGSNCEWFINGVLQSIPNNNTLVFNQEGIYEIMHQCTNAAGCLDKEIQFITAKFPNDFYIPTGFSPNNDGLNDVFGISGEGISKLQVVIYDSWGEEVFVIKDPDQTWDGKSISGEMLPDGLYVYKLEAHDIEGNPYYKNGTLIIIR